MATYEAACKRWSGNCLTLREGSRVIAHSRHTQPANVKSLQGRPVARAVIRAASS
jgi:hypothetical protein